MTATSATQIICSIYRSSKKEGMYLYVEKSVGLNKVPEPLLKLFGKPVQAFTLLLTPQKTLANVDIVKVMSSLRGDGYFLQMPPQGEEYMQEVNKKNSRL